MNSYQTIPNMAGPSRRIHARFSCNINIGVRSPLQGKDPFEAEMLNVGIGGAFVCVRGSLRGPYFHLVLPFGDKTFTVKANIAHSVGRDPHNRELYYYGFQFQAHLSNEHKLRRLIDRVRGRQWSGKTGSPDGELKRDYYSL